MLAAAAGTAWRFLSVGGPPGTVAAVYVEGELCKTVDLSSVAVPYEFTVETDLGYNIVRVSPGAVEVVEADCPGQDCVHQGAIEDGLIPIVCLPHHVVIQIEEP